MAESRVTTWGKKRRERIMRRPVDGREPKSGFGFFAVVALLQIVPGTLAQIVEPVGGLVWSELFAFALPALLAAAGSNLKARAFLLLARRPAAGEVALGFLC